MIDKKKFAKWVCLVANAALSNPKRFARASRNVCVATMLCLFLLIATTSHRVRAHLPFYNALRILVVAPSKCALNHFICQKRKPPISRDGACSTNLLFSWYDDDYRPPVCTALDRLQSEEMDLNIMERY